MAKKVAIIHTSAVSLDEIKGLFAQLMPSVELMNIIDDSLLNDTKANGGITPAVIKRLCNYAVQGQEAGADLLLNQCSSVSEAVDVARKMLRIPYLKIDEPMAEKAAVIGGKITVIATVETTMGPSCRLIQRMAREKGITDDAYQICPRLVDGALDILLKEKDQKKHNDMVRGVVEDAARDSNVIVLAQGSMTCLLPELGHIKVPVLTSPAMGVQRVKEVLGL